MYPVSGERLSYTCTKVECVKYSTACSFLPFSDYVIFM